MPNPGSVRLDAVEAPDIDAVGNDDRPAHARVRGEELRIVGATAHQDVAGLGGSKLDVADRGLDPAFVPDPPVMEAVLDVVRAQHPQPALGGRSVEDRMHKREVRDDHVAPREFLAQERGQKHLSRRRSSCP